MKIILMISAVIAALSCVTTAEIPKFGFQEPFKKTKGDGFIMSYFGNYINHFDSSDKRTYYQRLWYNLDDLDLDSGPIVVYLCGEYTCSVPEDRQFPHQLAKKHKGIYLILEHRFYGKSQPFKDWSMDSLKYLTVDNALADAAVLINQFREDFRKQKTGEKRKVIVIGGSYSGAMSAWMRYKYPHIVDASISSSGVVDVILDFNMYDYQIYNSTMKSQNGCTEVITNMTGTIDMLMRSNRTEDLNQIKSWFNAENLTDKDFAFFFADSLADKVQYGHRTEMCDAITKDGIIDVIGQLKQTASYFDVQSTEDYNPENLKNTTVDINKNMRQWTYQTCSELGYFQTKHENYFMRASSVNIGYFESI
jgi:hypothetical protein